MERKNQIKEIFISCSNEDNDKARRLKNVLEKKDFLPFLASTDLIPGEAIAKQIESKLEACDVFLLLWSMHANESKWVELELHSVITKKKVITLLIDDTPLPFFLTVYKYIDFRNCRIGYRELFTSLYN